MPDPRDPRSEEELARAALKRSQDMGLAPVESEEERLPSVTPATFGEERGFRDRAEGPDDVVTREDRDDPLPQAP